MHLFLRTRNVGVILDESTKIKNPDSAMTRTFLELGPLFTRRVIMTGTPVSNRPHDIWSQIKFLDNGASLGVDFGEFKWSVDLSNDLAGAETRQLALELQLQRIFYSISGFAVRETKASAKISLPEKVVHSVVTEWEPRQLDMYRQVRESLRAIVFQDGQLMADESDVILKRLLRLVQVTSNPMLIDSSYRVEPGKLETLLELVESIIKNGEKCIVWTSFVENVKWLAKILRRQNPQQVHGLLNTREQTESIRTFLNEPHPADTITTENSGTVGRLSWAHSSEVALLDTSLPFSVAWLIFSAMSSSIVFEMWMSGLGTCCGREVVPTPGCGRAVWEATYALWLLSSDGAEGARGFRVIPALVESCQHQRCHQSTA